MRIIDIIRDSFKHDDNRQERPNEGPILNLINDFVGSL